MPPSAHVPAPGEAINRFLAHLEQTLIAIGFLDERHPRKLMRRLTRLFRRANPDVNEVLILRGILSAIDKPQPPRRDDSDPPNT